MDFGRIPSRFDLIYFFLFFFVDQFRLLAVLSLSQSNGVRKGYIQDREIQRDEYLYQKDLYLPIVEKPKDMSDEEWVVERKPGGMVDAQWMVLDRKALGAIRLSLSKSVAFNIKGQETATDLMKALSNLYEQPSATRFI